MSNVYRTFTRCLGYVGIAGGLLASNAALAQDYPPYHSQASRVHISAVSGISQSRASGSAVVVADTRAKWTAPDGTSRYRNLRVPINAATLRQGAMAALGRGVMHPGFQLAVMAAGFAWSLNEGIYKQEDNFPGFTSEDGLTDHCPTGVYGFVTNGISYIGSPSELIGVLVSTNYYPVRLIRVDRVSARRLQVFYQRREGNHGNDRGGWSSNYNRYLACQLEIDDTKVQAPPFIPPSSAVPISESDFEAIENNIPPSLVDEIYNGQSVPDWQDSISVIGRPASDVESSGQIPPEVATAVGQWKENMDAQYQGDEPVYPDIPDSGKTPQEEYYDRELEKDEEWSGEVPPFNDPDINWQTETLTLPSYNSGIGGGSCPGPRVISLPMGQSMDIDYQPACDLASMVRPAFIGVCGFIALLIVVRARGGQ